MGQVRNGKLFGHFYADSYGNTFVPRRPAVYISDCDCKPVFLGKTESFYDYRHDNRRFRRSVHVVQL